MVVDGGQYHTGFSSLPYPESVLDPNSVKDIIRGKM